MGRAVARFDMLSGCVVRVDQFLELRFFPIALKSFNNFTIFEQEDGWNCCDTVLHGKFHVLGNVEFANFGIAVVIAGQLINDWTQSFARPSAV